MAAANGTGGAGASPKDWALLLQLGLVEDLLPVVSDPTVEIHPESKLKDLGKTPSRVGREGKAVGIPSWTQQRSTERQVMQWSKDPRLGVCLQTRRVRALDIDIPDAAAAAAVREFVELVQGVLPVRWREGSGKCLLAFTMEGDFSKRVLRTQHGAIEFLATGQQFIAFGRHTSGSHYQWDGLDLVEALGEFPVVTPAEYETLWAGLAEAFPGQVDTARRGVLPSVARSKLDMVGDPVVAFLQENGWVREFDRDGRVHVRCPWEHEHTSDSGPSATTYFPAGVGGFAQGHWRCLHAHCAGRGDAEWQEAVGYEASMFDVLEPEAREPAAEGVGEAVAGPGGVGLGARVPALQDLGPWPVLSRKKNGRVEPSMDNAVKAISRPDLAGVQLAYDSFRDEVMVAPVGGSHWAPLRDTHYTDLRVALERRGFDGVGKELVRDAVLRVAEGNTIDSATQWVEGLRWDGVPRVERFLAVYLGVEDSAYTRAVARYMWTAMAGRALVPGVKADMVPVLIGGQGIRKTTLVEALAPTPEAFVEIDLATRDADLARSLRGKLVGEIAELRGLASRDSESIKAWITRRFEEWVPKWRETTTRFWRRLLLIGTGNKPEFLDDETGERRWLPVAMGRFAAVDVEAVVRDRDQLWAEGAALFVAGGVDWRGAQELAEGVHHEHKVHDEWEEPVGRWLRLDTMDTREGVARAFGQWTLAEIAAGALGLDIKAIGRKEELRLGKVLRALGLEKQVVWLEGRAQKRWLLADSGAYLGVEKG